MSNWKELNLGKLGKSYSGLSGKTKEYFGYGKPYVPYLRIFEDGKIDTSRLDLVKVEKNEKQNTVKYGDLFFTTSSETVNEVGMTSVLLDEPTEDIYLNSFCFGFRLSDFKAILPDYARYLFRGNDMRKKISILGQGSTRYNLPKTILFEKLYLNVPELKHQQKIAKILNTVDAVIENTEKAIAKYQAIKKGMMQDLFTRGIDLNTGKLRPPYTEAPELYKESALGMIPEDWEVVRLDQIATVVSGGTPSTENQDYWNGNILWASPTDITKTTGAIIYKTEKKITVLGLKNSSAKLLPKGTLLMTSRATLGEIKISYSEITTNQGFKSLIINNEYSNWFYLYYMTMQKIRYSSFGIGTTFLEVNKKDTDAFMVIKPKPSEQSEISKRLQNCDDLIQKEQKTLAKNKKIKKGLMQDLLTGKVEVKV
jgi:type I restriction enzyme S subunit